MIHTLERFLEWGGVKKAVTCLVFSGIALLVSIFDLLPQLPFDAAWAAVVLCGIPIILEAVIGLVTAFDIKADVLVSIALIASLIIGRTSPPARWPSSCSWAPCWRIHGGSGRGPASRSWCI